MSWDKSLIIEQLDRMLEKLPSASEVPVYKRGWIYTLRNAIGMSARSLGERIGVNQSSITKLEKNESNKGITLRSLERAAEGLDYELVYYFKPKRGSLRSTVESRARRKVIRELNMLNVHMALGDQEVEKAELANMVENDVKDLIRTMPKELWDD